MSLRMVHPMAGTWRDGWPVRLGGTTGRVGMFGYTRDGGNKIHRGVDWIAEEGKCCYLPIEGVCYTSGPVRGFGLAVIVRGKDPRGMEIQLTYGHLGA